MDKTAREIHVSNIVTMLKSLSNENNKNAYISYIRELDDFTSLPKRSRRLSNEFLGTIYKDISYNENEYVIKTHDKKFYFRVLSDFITSKNLRNYLLDQVKRQDSLLVDMKIVLEKNLYNSFLHTVVENGEAFYTIVEYEKDGNKFISSSKDNIVMKKDDYIELFKPEIIQSLNKADVAKVKELLIDKPVTENFFYYLIFGNEILNSLGNIEPDYSHKYNDYGMHNNNWFITFNDSYVIGFIDCDRLPEMDLEIRQFTMNPTILTKNISKHKNRYVYKKRIPFKLLSDELGSDFDDVLLSNKREGFCHSDSLKILALFHNYSDNSYITSGQMKINECDSYYHSWVEVDDFVLDVTRNLIMRKKDYYKMLGITVINKTSIDLLKKNLPLEKKFGLKIDPIINNYFSQELNKDLERNKFLIKK